jgi:GNAT superfamily N-acetyltransferase
LYGITVRRVRITDAEQVRRARLAVLGEEEWRSHFLREEECFTVDDWAARATRGAQSAEFATFVALREAELIGIADGWLTDDKAVDVAGMWVQPDHRGQRIGRRLLQAIDEWARTRGAVKLCLTVVTANAPARRLYERAGFLAVGEPQPAKTVAGLKLQRMETEHPFRQSLLGVFGEITSLRPKVLTPG